MATDRKHITVDEVVRSVLGDEGKVTTHEYLRYLEIANRGLKELTYDILGDTKVALINIGTSLRADLPVDFVDYTYVGVVGSDGILHNYGIKRDIPLVGTGNTVRRRQVASYSRTAGVYGMGGGQNTNGYYSPNIDYENWQMVFTSAETSGYVYLEYISDGRSEGGENVVHPYAEEALIAWTYWKAIARKRGYSGAEKADARFEYYNQKRLANARLKSFTKEEMLQQSRKNFKQAPKI